ncbi:MAG: tetratricopeptide repeat protein [Betaproteobacteria bacterium]|nr:MAG: tetratricopeptide repeat protein [Betaproteobacteria bacterium]
MRNDARGVAITAGRAESLQHYETALQQFQSYVGDPIATLDAALEQDPEFVSGHLMKALVLFTLGERKFVAPVQASLDAAQARSAKASDRERMLMGAVRELLANDWHVACRTLDRVLIDHPRDVLALQTGHLMDFYRGDALNLRNRVIRVLPHWDASVPGYSYVLGMHAFGLEEMNQYPQAEQEARRALEVEPRDGWAVHAATHVMEMQGRIPEGIEWLESRRSDWAPDNGFAFHNWWHLALFYLDDARYDKVLELYDTGVHPEPSPILLSLVDASALLWRLTLEGVDLGKRFETIADEWEAQLENEAGYYAFNDLHAALAFSACGRQRSLARVKEAMTHAAAGTHVLAGMAREVGIPLVAGIEAFSKEKYREAIEAIEPVRDIANRFGGSHAQRDLLTLTLIEAALRSGDRARARHYLAERRVLKSPASRWGARLEARA